MEINWLSIIVAALIPLLVGFVWYNPKTFGTAWMKSAGMTEESMQGANMAVIFGSTFVLGLLLAMGIGGLATHDGFVQGALYYVTGGEVPAAGSEAETWWSYYLNNLAADNHTFKHGAFHGFMFGGFFISLPVLAINALFERKSWKYILINAGFWIVCCTLMGGLLAAW